jgi:hypothetical protein
VASVIWEEVSFYLIFNEKKLRMSSTLVRAANLLRSEGEMLIYLKRLHTFVLILKEISSNLSLMTFSFN